KNARAIADLFSEEAGRFVCASAGHHMECQLAAHGSGAVALSRGHNATLLNVDIGGGTTKFALIEKGRILATAALAVGGRLIVEDPKQGLTRIEDPVQEVAQSLGIPLGLGDPLKPEHRAKIVARMARLIMGMIDLRAPGELARRLLVTEPWPPHLANKGIDALTFSGGVAEYLYKRETRQFGDLGADLAHDLAHALGHRRDLPPGWDPGQRIRATAIGAAGRQYLPVSPAGLPAAVDPARRRLQGPARRYRRGGRGRRSRAPGDDARRPRGRREPAGAGLPLARRPLARAPPRARARHLR